MSTLDKKTLEHVAGLARIKLNPEKEEKYLHDLGKILDYFNELKELDTKNVSPIFSGSEAKNIFRIDELKEERLENSSCINQFPENERGFSKVPPVFEG